MAHILAQIVEQPIEDSAMIVLWLTLLLLPLVALVVLMVIWGRYVRFARAHVKETTKHWERVESLLAQIAVNTSAKHE